MTSFRSFPINCCSRALVFLEIYEHSNYADSNLQTPLTVFCCEKTGAFSFSWCWAIGVGSSTVKERPDSKLGSELSSGKI